MLRLMILLLVVAVLIMCLYNYENDQRRGPMDSVDFDDMYGTDI